MSKFEIKIQSKDRVLDMIVEEEAIRVWSDILKKNHLAYSYEYEYTPENGYEYGKVTIYTPMSRDEFQNILDEARKSAVSMNENRMAQTPIDYAQDETLDDDDDCEEGDE